MLVCALVLVLTFIKGLHQFIYEFYFIFKMVINFLILILNIFCCVVATKSNNNLNANLTNLLTIKLKYRQYK